MPNDEIPSARKSRVPSHIGHSVSTAPPEKKLKIASKLWKFGFFGLPILWAFNYFLFRVFSPEEKQLLADQNPRSTRGQVNKKYLVQIEKYVKYSKYGFFSSLFVFLLWILIYQTSKSSWGKTGDDISLSIAKGD